MLPPSGAWFFKNTLLYFICLLHLKFAWLAFAEILLFLLLILYCWVLHGCFMFRKRAAVYLNRSLAERCTALSEFPNATTRWQSCTQFVCNSSCLQIATMKPVNSLQTQIKSSLFKKRQSLDINSYIYKKAFAFLVGIKCNAKICIVHGPVWLKDDPRRAICVNITAFLRNV